MYSNVVELLTDAMNNVEEELIVNDGELEVIEKSIGVFATHYDYLKQFVEAMQMREMQIELDKYDKHDTESNIFNLCSRAFEFLSDELVVTLQCDIPFIVVAHIMRLTEVMDKPALPVFVN